MWYSRMENNTDKVYPRIPWNRKRANDIKYDMYSVSWFERYCISKTVAVYSYTFIYTVNTQQTDITLCKISTISYRYHSMEAKHESTRKLRFVGKLPWIANLHVFGRQLLSLFSIKKNILVLKLTTKQSFPYNKTLTTY